MRNSLKITVLIFTTCAYLLTKEVNLILALLYVIIKARTNTKLLIKSKSKLWPIYVLTVLGLITGIENVPNDIFRDLFLSLKIPIYFWFGAILSKKVRNNIILFKCLKLIALISAIIHIISFINHYQAGESLYNIRKEISLESLPESIFLGMIISRSINKHFNSTFSNYPKTPWYLNTLLLASFVMYFSRSMFISCAVMVIFLSNYLNIRYLFTKKNKNLMLGSFLLIMSFLLMDIIISSNSSENVFNTFYNKFKNIPTEVFWDEKKNRDATLQEINNNWRGYESYQGLMKFYNATTYQKLLGYGYGSLVDLGLTMNLGGKDFDKIPVLHNGYVGLLIKTGLLGILLYLLFLYNIGFSKKDSREASSFFPNQFLSALSIIIALNTFTIAGLLNPSEAISPIMIGILWGISKKLSQPYNYLRKQYNDVEVVTSL